MIVEIVKAEKVSVLNDEELRSGKRYIAINGNAIYGETPWEVLRFVYLVVRNDVLSIFLKHWKN